MSDLHIRVPATDHLVKLVVQRQLENAAASRRQAGNQGAHHDYGAAELEQQVNCFMAGREGKWPNGWTEVVTAEAGKYHSPEYQTYLKLKAKFEP